MTQKPYSLLGPVLWLALVPSCASTTEPRPAAAAAPSAGAERAQQPAPSAPAPDRAWHMQETFWMALRARDAVIAGDLEVAREEARLLAHHEFADTLPAAWKPYTERMKQQAQSVVVAGSLEEAAQGVAALGLSCGNCHFTKHGPHALREPPMPWLDPPDTLFERMYRHYEGVDQLWQGMVQPSEEA
jgi:hypothetical protein